MGDFSRIDEVYPAANWNTVDLDEYDSDDEDQGFIRRKNAPVTKGEVTAAYFDSALRQHLDARDFSNPMVLGRYKKPQLWPTAEEIEHEDSIHKLRVRRFARHNSPGSWAIPENAERAIQETLGHTYDNHLNRRLASGTANTKQKVGLFTNTHK